MANSDTYLFNPSIGSLALNAFGRKADIIGRLRFRSAQLTPISEGRPLVYVAVNAENGNLYVGVTKQRLARRAVDHFSCAESKRRDGIFQRAIRRYGRAAFEFLTVSVHSDYVVAQRYERKFIAALKPEYNLTSGGEGTLGWVPSAETRQKISVANKGKPGPWAQGIPDELRAKMVENRKAKGDYGAPLRGRKRPPEVVEKIAAKRRGRSIPSSTPELKVLRIANFKRASEARSIAIECLDDGKTFSTIRSAAEYYGINKSYLANVVVRGYSAGTAKGLQFAAVVR